MKKTFVVLLLLFSRGALALTLAEAERLALANYPRLKAAKAEGDATRAGAEAQNSKRWPRLSLEGTGRYVSNVPNVTLGPNSIPFGSNWNYSVGPTLSFTLFDAGAQRDIARSLSKLAEAKGEESKAATLQVLAATRIAYAQVQISKQELSLVEKSLELARSQHRDITNRLRAGSSSQFDLATAAREVSSYEVRAESAKAEYEASLQELSAYTGPLETSSLVLDPLESALESAQQLPAPRLEAHPNLKVQQRLVESADLSARGATASHWPTVQLSARTSLEYPNGPILQHINQNSVGLNLSWALWDWGQASSTVEQKRAEVNTAKFRQEQTLVELRRDFEKASARLKGLEAQRKSAERMVKESEELARLSYRNYKAGQINLLDAQAMNLRFLEAQVQKARIYGQLIVQAALVKSLSGQEENP